MIKKNYFQCLYVTQDIEQYRNCIKILNGEEVWLTSTTGDRYKMDGEAYCSLSKGYTVDVFERHIADRQNAVNADTNNLNKAKKAHSDYKIILNLFK